MKNIIYICIVLTCVLLLCIFLPKSNQQNSSKTLESLTVPNSYIVREYNGQVAVFSSDSNLPIKIFDTAVSTLPESDRALLESGIQVKTPEELQRIIEDFTG